MSINETSEELEKTPDEMVQVALTLWRSGTRQSLDEAKSLLLKASELCNPEAMLYLGTLLLQEFNNQEDAKKWFQKAAELGSAAAANSLIYSILLPAKMWPEIEKMVQLAVATNTLNQSTNAMSNGAIAKYLEGKVEESISAFIEVLARDDHFADGEASWWLAMIYNKLGDKENELKFRKFCSKLGGYAKPDLTDNYEDIGANESFTPLEDASNYEKLVFAWQKALESGKTDSLADDFFIAANYAELAVRGDVKLTDSGNKKVENALQVLKSQK